MLRPLDVLYTLAVAGTAPLWLPQRLRTGRMRTAWRDRLGHIDPLPPASDRRVLLHAVSVGEVNAIRLLVRQLREAEPTPDVVIAVTTDTGIARARDHFGEDHAVIRAPLDYSFAVRRVLDAVRPDVVAHVELEIWPNLTAECHRRGIGIAVINGRISERSYRRYRRIAWPIRHVFRRIDAVAAQTRAYAERFTALGVAPDRVEVTGTMKWDSAELAVDEAAAAALAESLGVDRGTPLIVAGSTAPGEHELLHAATPPGVQLLCAPRRPEWFDGAEAALPGCARRSSGRPGSPTGRFLLDTIGELRLAYALADVVIVGRSFGNLHGSDMMEPVGLGRPTIVGPRVGDFRDTMDVLLEHQAILQVTAEELPEAIAGLLEEPQRRSELVERGRAAIQAQQGASARNAGVLQAMLARR